MSLKTTQAKVLKATKRDVLVAVCEDMNNVMSLNPPIEIGDHVAKGALFENIAEMTDSIRPTDKFKRASEDFMAEAGLLVRKAEAKKSAVKKDTGTEKPSAVKKDTGTKASPKKDTKKDTKKAPPKKTAAKVGYSRPDAVVDAINKLCVKGAVKKDIAKKADDLYAAKGGTHIANLKHFTNVPNNMIKALVSFGVLEVVDGKCKFIDDHRKVTK